MDRHTAGNNIGNIERIVDELIGICERSSPFDRKQFDEAWSEFVNHFTSKEFARYRDTLGKLSLMLPYYTGLQTPGENVHFEAYLKILEYANSAFNLVSSNQIETSSLLRVLSGLHSYLRIIEYHHQDIDFAFTA